MLRFISTLLIVLLSFTMAKAEIIQGIEIKNNLRVSKQTIINFGKVELGKEGRVFVRKSGTEPLLRINVRDVLIAPIKDKIIVPKKRTITKNGIIFESKSIIKHKKGEHMITGKQDTIQKDMIFETMAR